ncbi:MAG: hypothetical protein GWO07_08140 [Candidatus Dadabacteria bacterium]|nr:hypothetical protein [Candidatus Dadabacteria bacterium]NIS08714.1 hypothetical protein [Candidatus Dadabacteria bacterium]NIV42196.1 hypothetical protein [Candidatus Dadabacteria bacterium]NIX15400.1 hypothetical protein [Candidatus Dadabacteria bacterium]NIY22063.1 hypothetical protein [Candidatus Dadabacteria bacterium]
MKILLDEGVPTKFKNLLKEFDVQTVVEAGWAGIKNGLLLKRASGEYSAFITVDRNLSFQQNPQKLSLAVFIIHSKSNRLKDLEQFIPDITELLKQPLTNDIYEIRK